MANTHISRNKKMKQEEKKETEAPGGEGHRDTDNSENSDYDDDGVVAWLWDVVVWLSLAIPLTATVLVYYSLTFLPPWDNGRCFLDSRRKSKHQDQHYHHNELLSSDFHRVPNGLLERSDLMLAGLLKSVQQDLLGWSPDTDSTIDNTAPNPNNAEMTTAAERGGGGYQMQVLPSIDVYGVPCYGVAEQLEAFKSEQLKKKLLSTSSSPRDSAATTTMTDESHHHRPDDNSLMKNSIDMINASVIETIIEGHPLWVTDLLLPPEQLIAMEFPIIVPLFISVVGAFRTVFIGRLFPLLRKRPSNSSSSSSSSESSSNKPKAE